MLVLVNQPLINDFRIEGTLSADFLDSLRKDFGSDLVVKMDDDEGWVRWEDTGLCKEWEHQKTAGENLRFYRKASLMTQKELAAAIGMSAHHISDMENGRREISKATAKALADIFHAPVERFL